MLSARDPRHTGGLLGLLFGPVLSVRHTPPVLPQAVPQGRSVWRKSRKENLPLIGVFPLSMPACIVLGHPLTARMYRSGASADAKEERRERTHHLCNLGGLVEKAGLGNLEAPVLLGMLLQQAEYLRANPGIENRWKERGIAALNMPER